MEIVLMNDNAIVPTRDSKRSAGLDLYSSIDARIEINSIKKINTGINTGIFFQKFLMDLLEINLL